VAELIKLEVATPDGMALDTQVEMVTAPSVNGEFGVLPGHLPLLAATRAGVLRYRVGNKDEVAAIGPGFVEAGPSKVLVLTDAFAVPATIDKAAAEKDLAAAEKGMAESKAALTSGEHIELQRALDWARARVEVAKA